LREQTLDGLEIRPGISVLELGCGTDIGTGNSFPFFDTSSEADPHSLYISDELACGIDLALSVAQPKISEHPSEDLSAYHPARSLC
jgi:hypothetical protein